jgi:ABC-type glycerol-3-phosphate transport system permease component
LLLAVVILAPVAWLFVMSISPAADLSAKPLHWWPQEADFSRYKLLLSTVETAPALPSPRLYATASRLPAWRRSPHSP